MRAWLTDEGIEDQRTVLVDALIFLFRALFEEEPHASR